METEFHIAGRGAGKTYDLMEWVMDPDPKEWRIVVVHSVEERTRLRNQYGTKVGQAHIQTMSTIMRKDFGRAIPADHRILVGVDNVEMVLSELLQHDIGRITGNGYLEAVPEEENPHIVITPAPEIPMVATPLDLLGHPVSIKNPYYYQDPDIPGPGGIHYNDCGIDGGLPHPIGSPGCKFGKEPDWKIRGKYQENFYGKYQRRWDAERGVWKDSWRYDPYNRDQ